MDIPEINKYTIGKSNVYLIVNGFQSVLVDTGTSGKLNRFIKILNEHNLQLSDLDLIILTHVHYDHTGTLADLKNNSDAAVLVGFPEDHYLERGYSPLPKGVNILGKTVSGVGSLVGGGKFKAVKPDIVVQDEFTLNEYGIKGEVISTPGHTEGSLSVVINKKAAIVGDTFFNAFTGSLIPPFANDLISLHESWLKLYNMGIEIFYPGHGKPFGRKLVKKNLPLLEKKIS